MSNSISPLHYSIYPKIIRKPAKMESIKLPPGSREDITDIALSIWTDCINRGVPFQDAILAVYLSGIENGASASKGTTEQ